MAVSCGVSFNICRLRITELDEVGNGGGATYVTDQVQSVAVSVNQDTGNSFVVRNGCGCKISSVRLPNVFNGFEFTFTDASLEPALQALALGADTIADGADTVGLHFAGELSCDEANPAVALEFWTQHYVGSSIDGTYPYVHWVFPWTEWTLGDNTFEEGPASPVLTGTSKGNQRWGSGPHGDGPPDGSDVIEGAYWLTDTALPAADCAAGTVAPGS